MKNTILPLILLLTIITLGQTTGILFGVKSAFGYGGGGFYSPFIAPSGGVSIVINDGDEKTSSQTVVLALSGGSSATKMSISNSSSFSGAIQEEYKTTKTWTLDGEEGEKTVYVKFYNTSGSSSQITSDSIVYGISTAGSSCRGIDTNNDGSIDVLDFNALMVNWGDVDTNNVADFDCDNKVAILDFNLLMVNWTA